MDSIFAVYRDGSVLDVALDQAPTSDPRRLASILAIFLSHHETCVVAISVFTDDDQYIHSFSTRRPQGLPPNHLIINEYTAAYCYAAIDRSLDGLSPIAFDDRAPDRSCSFAYVHRITESETSWAIEITNTAEVPSLNMSTTVFNSDGSYFRGESRMIPYIRDQKVRFKRAKNIPRMEVIRELPEQTSDIADVLDTDVARFIAKRSQTPCKLEDREKIYVAMLRIIAGRQMGSRGCVAAAEEDLRCALAAVDDGGHSLHAFICELCYLRWQYALA